MKKCVIYGRVSKEEVQDYNRQVFELATFAKNNNYQIVAEFTEKVSGAKEKKEQLDAMREYIRAHDIKTILVTELTRIGRLGHKTRDLIEDITSTGVNIYFKDKGLQTMQDGRRNDTNLMLIGILCDIAQQELISLKNRITSGLRYAASKGRGKGGAFMPYGYTKNESKELVIEPIEAETIKLIFKKYLEGNGASLISAHLNDLQIPTRFNITLQNRKTKTKTGIVRNGDAFRWSAGTVIGILKNSLYKGERIHNDEIFAVPSIIDANTFDRVQEILTEKGNRSIKTITNDNYLKGLIKCGVCGQPYYMHMRKSGKDSAYKCLSTKLKYEKRVTKECNSPAIGIQKLLDSIIAEKSHIIELTQTIVNKNKQENNFDEQLTQLKKEAQKLDKRYNNLLDMREDGSIDKKEFNLRKEKIDASVKDVQSQMNAINKKKNTLTTTIDSTDILQQLRKAIKQITIAPPTKSELKKLPYSPKDTAVKITLTSRLDDSYSTSYFLSRYSKQLVKDDYSSIDFEKDQYLKELNDYVSK